MFVSEKIVFLELHKTGGSHIGHLLSSLLEGEQVGKHNTLKGLYRNRTILGSIRNPRSEERRVGKECRTRWAADHEKKRKVLVGC